MRGSEKIENGRVILDNGYGSVHDFEIVEKVPKSYSVWCYPDICVDGKEFAPFCMTVNPGDKNCYDVNIHTLKAIELPEGESKILRDSAHAGADTLEKAIMFLKRAEKPGYLRSKNKYQREYKQRCKERVEKALPIFEKITKQ